MATLKEFNLTFQKMALAHKAVDKSLELNVKYANFTWLPEKKTFEHTECPASTGDWNGIMLIPTPQTIWSVSDEALVRALTSATELKPGARVFIRGDNGVVREVSACEPKLTINITVGETSTLKPAVSTSDELAKLFTGASDEEIGKLATSYPTLVYSTFYRIGNTWYTSKTLEEKYPLLKKRTYLWVLFDVSNYLGSVCYRRCFVSEDFLLKPEIKDDAFERFAERMFSMCEGTLTMFADYDFVKNEAVIDVVTQAAPIRVRVKVDEAGDIVAVSPVSDTDKPYVTKAGIKVPAVPGGAKVYTLKPLKGLAGHSVIYPEGGNQLPHKLVCVSVADKDILVGYWVEYSNTLLTPCPNTVRYAKELGLTLLADYPSNQKETSLPN